MESQELLERILSEKFVGRSDYYPKESEAGYLEIRLEPKKLIIEHKHPNQNALIIHEAEYDEDFSVVAFREKRDDSLHKEYSQKEIEEDEYNIIGGHFLFRDPRYALQHGHDFAEQGNNTFTVVAYEEEVPLFGNTSVVVEIDLREDGFVMTRRKFVKGDRELDNQRETVEFRRV